MKYLLLFFICTTLYFLTQYRFDDQYQAGYAAGVKESLKTNPPSDELELVCAGLWVGEQNKKYWEKSNAR